MAKTAALLTVAVGVLTGCSVFGSRDNVPPISPSTAAATAPRGANGDSLTLYLQTLHDLVDGDAVVQADAFRKAQEAAEAAPTTTNRLNLALALAMPGHPSSNPREAQRMLNELLAAPDSLLPEERILAMVHLKEVEQRLILDAEAERLQRAAAAAAAQRNDQASQRLQAALEENKQLRAELDDAHAKLNAITNIERSIRERENGANPK